MSCSPIHASNGDPRMVVDARRVNARHRRPPHTMLGAVEALAEIDASPLASPGKQFGKPHQADICASDADLQDDFYQMAVPRLASRFRVREQFRAAELGVSKIWDDEAGRYIDVSPDMLVFPLHGGHGHGLVLGSVLLQRGLCRGRAGVRTTFRGSGAVPTTDSRAPS